MNEDVLYTVKRVRDVKRKPQKAVYTAREGVLESERGFFFIGEGKLFSEKLRGPFDTIAQAIAAETEYYIGLESEPYINPLLKVENK